MKNYIPKKYWEDLLQRDFSLSGVGYQGLGKNYNKWLYRGRTRIMEWFLKKYPLDIKNLSILDIGCGTGFYVDFWKRKGATKLVGVDITEKSVSELSRRYGSYKFLCGDIGIENLDDIGIQERKFDLITALDVLFHIVEEKHFDNAITNISRLSKKGAILIISDNFLKKPRPQGFNQTHRTFERYERMLEKNDIEILELKPIFCLMNGPIDIRNNMVFRVYSFLWSVAMRLLGRSELGGEILGSILYVIDGALIKFIKNSVTTELMICRKR